jgi:putative ABC transport system permease protein
MKTNDLIELAGRNLREALLRNSLTTLGIGVGVASLVAMLSLGAGLQDLVSQRFQRSGLFNTLAVFSPRDMRGMDRGERRTNREAVAAPDPSRSLDQNARAEISKLPNVLEVYPEIRLLTDIGFEGRTLFTSVSGLSPSARESDAFEDMTGKFFSGPQAEETILQVDFARELLAPEGGDATAKLPAATPAALSTLLGKVIILRYAERQPLDQQASQTDPAKQAPRAKTGVAAGSSGADPEAEASFSVTRREKTLRIVGIIETAPYAGLGSGSSARVFLPVGLAEKLQPVVAVNLRDLLRPGGPSSQSYQALVLRVSNPRYVPETQEAIKKMGFRTFSLLDATRSIRRVFVVLDMFLGIFGSVALVVASLGILNTLVMSVLERRREIGIMKALGASDGDVKRLFFAEAGAMGLAGGVGGLALGWLLGRAINLGTNIYLQRQDLPHETIVALPLWLAAGAVLFSIVVSLVSGLYPAARAAKLDPVQALRYE